MNLTQVYPELAEDPDYIRYGRQAPEHLNAAYLLRRYPFVRDAAKIRRAAYVLTQRERYNGRSRLTDLIIKNIMIEAVEDDPNDCCPCD